MEYIFWVSFLFGLFACHHCRQGIRLSDKRMAAVAQMNNAQQSASNPAFQALLDAASDGFLSRDEIRRFAPDTPSPNDVECYVEVETYRTERIGGRCVNFGRTNLRICQAGEYSGPLFNSQCRRPATTATQATAPETP